MNANYNECEHVSMEMSEVDKLRAARMEAAAAREAKVEQMLRDAENSLVAAVEALGSRVTRYTVRHQDINGVVTTEYRGLEYIDDVYFGSDWGFYEQGSGEGYSSRKQGNGKLAFRYNLPVSYEKRIIRERKQFAGGFDFQMLAAELIGQAAACRPAAIERLMDQAKREMEDALADRQRARVDQLNKEAKEEGVKDPRIQGLYIRPEGWGRSEGVEFSFRVANIQEAREVFETYFRKVV